MVGYSTVAMAGRCMTILANPQILGRDIPYPYEEENDYKGAKTCYPQVLHQL